MSLEYQLELVWLRLVLKRGLTGDGVLKVSLWEALPDPDSPAKLLQSEELPIRRFNKIVDLDAISSFKFKASKEDKPNRFNIKYEIRSNSDQRIRNVPVDPAKMITELEKDGRSVFEQHFEGQSAQIIFKFYLTRAETYQLTVNSPEESHLLVLHRSNSISRSKRPPDLNLSRRNGSPVSSQGNPRSMQTNQISVPRSAQTNTVTVTNSHAIRQQQPQSSTRGKTRLPISDIDKVNELLTSHHMVDGHGGPQPISIKMKLVIIMLIIGGLFLLYDTLSDRKTRRRNVQAASHGEHEHGHGHGNEHGNDHGHQEKASGKKKKKRSASHH